MIIFIVNKLRTTGIELLTENSVIRIVCGFPETRRNVSVYTNPTIRMLLFISKVLKLKFLNCENAEIISCYRSCLYNTDLLICTPFYHLKYPPYSDLRRRRAYLCWRILWLHDLHKRLHNQILV